MRWHRPVPDRDHLLLVEDRHLCVALNLRSRFLFAAAHLPQPNLVARIGRKLAADEVADPCPQAVLPGVKLFQPGARLLGQAGRAAAEVTQLLHLAEELHRIFHPIDSELQRIHVVGTDRERRLSSRQVGRWLVSENEGPVSASSWANSGSTSTTA